MKESEQQNEERKLRRKIFSRRNFLISSLGTGLAGVGAAGYGFLIEPDLIELREQTLVIPNLPFAFDQMKVVQLTDIHFRQGKDEQLMENVVETVNALDADVIFHTGDYVPRDLKSLAGLGEYFKRLKCRGESYAILGNHDVWHGSVGGFRQFFDDLGIELLVNASARIKRTGEELAVVGLDSAWGGKPDVQKAFQGIDQNQAAITLMHEPDYFDEIIKHRENLCQLSGHTHGGQCRVPLVDFAPVTVKYGEKYVDGHFTNGSNQQLFVSTGIGTSGLRVRFSCKPEVVLITLKRA